MPPYDPLEKTKTEIIKAAGRLFDEKGWGKVKIEDIVKEVGVTRGAFYHYFKSREDLIYAVIVQSLIEDNPFLLAEKEKGLSALEKLRFVLKHSLRMQIKIAAESDILKTMYEPVVLKSNIFSSMVIMASAIENLLVEGNRDGSTKTEYPKHMAHAIILVCNEWLNPTVYKMSKTEFFDRLSFIELFGERMGVPVLDAELKEMLFKLYEYCREK